MLALPIIVIIEQLIALKTQGHLPDLKVLELAYIPELRVYGMTIVSWVNTVRDKIEGTLLEVGIVLGFEID
jgi:L-lactate permease